MREDIYVEQKRKITTVNFSIKVSLCVRKLWLLSWNFYSRFLLGFFFCMTWHVSVYARRTEMAEEVDNNNNGRLPVATLAIFTEWVMSRHIFLNKYSFNIHDDRYNIVVQKPMVKIKNKLQKGLNNGRMMADLTRNERLKKLIFSRIKFSFFLKSTLMLWEYSLLWTKARKQRSETGSLSLSFF